MGAEKSLRSTRRKRRTGGKKAAVETTHAGPSHAPPPATAAVAAPDPSRVASRPPERPCPASIRPATAADAPAVAFLWADLLRSHASLGEEWALGEGAVERYAEMVAAAAVNSRLLYLVAEMEVDGKMRVVGYLHGFVKLRNSVYRESVVGEIPSICVASEFQRRGIGSALAAAAAEWFANRGITRIQTVAAAASAPARAFWRGRGFRDHAAVLWAEVPPGPAGDADPNGGPQTTPDRASSSN